MNDIKVIIMDVDGTLTNNEKVITAKTKEVLVKAQKAGAILVLASGRPTSGLRDIAKELEMEKHHGLLVSFNGSKVVDCETNEVLFNETMSVDEGQEVLEHMKKFEVIPMIDKDNYMFVNDVFNNEIDYNGNSINIIKYESRGGKFNLCEIAIACGFQSGSYFSYTFRKKMGYGPQDYRKQITIVNPDSIS